MTTLWLYRMAKYMWSKEGLISAQHIIQRKIDEQNYFTKIATHISASEAITKEKLLLIEARAAKAYWKKYTLQLPKWTLFKGRKPHSEDMVNKLLDIGYHVLANKLEKLIKKHAISSALAVLHVPHSEKSKPLVYDLMELFRVHVVDEEVITFLHRKKRPLAFPLSQHEVRKFITQINKKCERKLYIRELKQCHTYNYYIELQLLHYIHAVNHKKIFIPFHAPKRHENRCS